jgi:AraC-like DNA-binding protein
MRIRTDMAVRTIEIADPQQAHRLIWESLPPQHRSLLNERETCSREYEPLDWRRFRAEPEDFRSQFSFAPLSGMRVSRVADSRATQVTIRAAGLDAHLIAVMEKGNCRLVLPHGSTEPPIGTTETGLVYRGERGARFGSSDQSVRLILWVSGKLLRDRLALLLDGREVKSFAFNPTFNQTRGAGATVRGMLGFLFAELTRSDSLLSNDVAISSFEDNLMLCLLLGLSHSHTERLQQQVVAAAPRNLRKAEEFMRHNVCAPVTIAEVADAAGCSIRALQMAFRRFGSTTPMAALRRIRLEAARTEVLRTDRTESLAQIAAGYGFSNPSRFAQLYRRTYGTYPSDVLRNAR